MITRDETKFVVLDVSLDRNWDIYYDLAKELNARTIVIRLDPSLEIVRQWLLIRDGPDGMLLSQLDRFRREHENCRQYVTADITIGDNYEYS